MAIIFKRKIDIMFKILRHIWAIRDRSEVDVSEKNESNLCFFFDEVSGNRVVLLSYST